MRHAPHAGDLVIVRCCFVLTPTARQSPNKRALLAPPPHLTRDVQPTNHAPQTASRHCPRPPAMPKRHNTSLAHHRPTSKPTDSHTTAPRATPHIQDPRYPSLRTLAWSAAAPPPRSALTTSTWPFSLAIISGVDPSVCSTTKTQIAAPQHHATGSELA